MTLERETMTDDQTSAQTAQDADPAPEHPEPGQADGGPEKPPLDAESGDSEQTDPQVAKLRTEAASYRRKLRDAEAERDAVRLRLDALESREVERLAAERLADPADFWRAGATIDELRDDDGGLDPERVKEAVSRVAGEHPHWRRVESPDFDGGAREPAPEGPPSFGEAIKKVAGS